MPNTIVPFNRPLFLEQGLAHVRTAFKNSHVSGDGQFTRQCQEFFEKCLGANKVLLTTSCSDALELCALLLDIKQGDEVIVPAFTFVTSASSFVLRGATPIFADIRGDTFNLDENGLQELVTPRTKAIVAVHYAGVGCEMDAIFSLAANHGTILIEDNAHGLLGAYKGKPLGSFGQLAALSFHETKNLSCGEGGALVINDRRFAARAEILREKGTDRSRFFRGEVDKYSWIDLGSSFLPSDVLAALLWAQIEVSETIQAKRQQIHRRYVEGLGDWAQSRGVVLPVMPAHCHPGYHLFSLLLPSVPAQVALISHLREKGVHAVFHYQPLHLTPMGRRLGGKPGQCPVAESVASRIVRLPFYFDLLPAEQDLVISSVRSYTP